ncbi:hypothetical protein LCGC14_2912250 [marine sediment metagenome]|uniref:Uncharacterized protein n=1 Tax=marine sediment metagenome TaxID=412755 RepID=A0A0F8XRL9_9ZZZZ
MIKISNYHKKGLIILGFDNSIFYNPTNTYSMNIKADHILPAKYFFSQLTNQVKLFDPYKFAHHTNFLLLTGRPSNQERLILSLLRKKGFRIGEAFFSNYHFNISRLESLTTESDFLIKYWSAKVELINKIQKSNKYNSITIIESDKVICTMLNELRFTVIQTQITNFQSQLFINFTSFNQNAHIHQLEKVMMYG